MASDKALICGLGGNVKMTVTNEMSLFINTRFYHERPLFKRKEKTIQYGDKSHNAVFSSIFVLHHVLTF